MKPLRERTNKEGRGELGWCPAVSRGGRPSRGRFGSTRALLRVAATDERQSTAYDESIARMPKVKLMPMPQAQADKLIAKVAQPLPRHYNGQGYGFRASQTHAVDL